MTLNTIKVDHLLLPSVSIWQEKWFVLTAGDMNQEKYNSMTISWGSIGVVWNKPFVQVFVRPSRFTWEIMNDFPDFTICAFAEKYRIKLQLIGSRSGREMDKINAAGLTPCAATKVVAPGFREAELIIECRKLYQDTLNQKGFIDPAITQNYPANDIHHVFFGEILAVNGIDQYSILN